MTGAVTTPAPAKPPTPAQIKALHKAAWAENGIMMLDPLPKDPGPEQIYGRAAKLRMLARTVEAGWLQALKPTGWRLTDLGRSMLRVSSLPGGFSPLDTPPEVEAREPTLPGLPEKRGPKRQIDFTPYSPTTPGQWALPAPQGTDFGPVL